ncbi:unnamed protein product [Calypogeia fissa]
MDALSRILQQAVTNGELHGTCIDTLQIHNAHGMYADDIRMILQAVLRYILKCMEIFETFGKASGLYCRWKGTKAVFLSARPVPAELLALGWEREDDDKAGGPV